MRNASQIKEDAKVGYSAMYCPCCGDWVQFGVADDQDGPDVCLEAFCAVCESDLELYVTLSEAT